MPTEKVRRLPAEWEAQSAIQFTFPHAQSDWAAILDEVTPCFVQLIETVTYYEKSIVVCDQLARVAPLLRGAVAENLELIELPSNDTWARDHAAITILEDEKPILLDFMFNGWGLKFAADQDNLLSQRLFDKKIFKTDTIQKGGLVLEGGGIESDGRGTLLTTAECLLSPNRNPHLSKSELETHLKKLFGVERILWLNHGYLAGDDTDSHIDTLARFCDEKTIAYVQCNDPEDEHFEALQQMEAELKTFRTFEGEPYRLVALPMSAACFDAEGQRLPATYANFLIINGAVLVPTYNVPQDAEALDLLRGVFSDRKVIGIDCRVLIEQHGSLHCVTMQFPKGTV
jgi:agmatine deiminase